MTDPRWQQVEDLFHHARALPPNDRSAYLLKACPEDPRVRGVVERLLDAEPDADRRFSGQAPLDGLLEWAGPGKPAAQEQPAFGAWRPVQKLGSGGMGEVWLAERHGEQFQIRGALKLLKAGLDSEDLRKRFLNERHILGQLEHPAIARLLDGGITASGAPYLVMEYVEGQAIDAWCAAGRTDVRERVALFRKVCEAVGYAHSHLVVHRDIKPSNILVTGTGTVKLLDFGIAKLLDAPAGEETSASAVLMTPRYASPEQALGNPITVQSDVYSLGIVLFELLCGRSPYANTQRSVAEWFQAISTEEAPLASRAAPPEVARLVSGDLELILAKAMAKAPAERYSSVEQFDADLGRHLDGLPVSARPQTAVYRLKKFARRHWAGVAAATVAVLALVTGLGVALWQGHIAERERQRAERRFEQVRDLARLSLFDLLDAVRDMPGSTPAQRLLITRSLEHFERLTREASGDPALLGEVARGYVRLGDLYGNPYSANLGDTPAALATYRRGLALLASIPEGSGPPALELSRAMLSRGLGEVLATSGETQSGLDRMRRASALLEKMVTVHPNDPELLAEYASGLASLGDHYGGIGVGKAVDEAQSVNCYTHELAVWRQIASLPSVTPALSLRARRGMAIACMKLGNVARAAGRFEEALGRYRQAAGTLRQLPPAEQATTTSVRLRVAIAKGTADSLTALSRPEEALATLDQELEEARRLQSADPENRQSSASMLLLFKSRGDLHKAAGRRDAALADYRSAEEIAAKTLAEDPANKVNQGRLEDLRALIAGTASMRTAPKGAR